MVGGGIARFWGFVPPHDGGGQLFLEVSPPPPWGGNTGVFRVPPMERDSRSGILEAEAWAQSEVSKQAKSI